MKFDDLGLPKENGADDFQDSARFAGLLCLFGKEGIPIDKYCLLEDLPVISVKHYVRHPIEFKYTFSRDQAICLTAGLYSYGLIDCVLPDYRPENGDIIAPSARGHFRRCAGLSANWLQNLWLKVDILFHAYFTPLEEPNQLLCMMMIAGNEYVDLWKRHNPRWAESIVRYWSGWRKEPELAMHMVESIQDFKRAPIAEWYE